MISASLAPLVNHLWQSTLFATVAGLVTLVLRRNQARVRYRLWLAASYKFLLPFSWLVSVGHQFEWRTAPAVMPHAFSSVTDIVSGPIFLTALPAAKSSPNYLPVLLLVIWGVWICGFLVVTAGWVREWLRIRTIVRAASPLSLDLPIRVVSTPARLEPGVFGIFRPVLLLPEGIASRLAQAQLQAILTHELCHVRRRDNLAAALHMLVEALFWFHPLVWWLGARMVNEREHACDEEVLQSGSQAQVYAESILKVCEFYLESPLNCISGVTGSDLKRRMERIMSNHSGEALNAWRKVFLTTAGVVALAVPLVVGTLTAPQLGAQAPAGTANRPVFELASIKPSSNSPDTLEFGAGDGQGGGRYVTLKILVGLAYRLQDFQISGGPGWVSSDRFDVEGKAQDPTADPDQCRLMLQSLLEDRFQLRLHRETKEAPIYALVVGEGGPKIKWSADQTSPPVNGPAPPGVGPNHGAINIGRSSLIGNAATMALFTRFLSQRLGRTVIDKTNLTGRFDIQLRWSPDVGEVPFDPGGILFTSRANDSSEPSVFAAIQDQLGLKLESTRAPVDILVIDHAERP
jgi:bla regulator protein BlaR1